MWSNRQAPDMLLTKNLLKLMCKRMEFTSKEARLLED